MADAARAAALAAVVVGHWLQNGFTFRAPDATPPGEAVTGWELVEANPLDALGWAAPVTWLVGVLGVFFCIGGRLSAESWRRAASWGSAEGGCGPWLRRRLGGFARPMAGALGLVAALVAGARLAGVPGRTLITLVTMMARPLWFLGIYALLTLATPALVALDRRAGLAAPAAMVACVAAVDGWRWGPLAASAPAWAGWINLAPGWAFAYQLGIWWSSRTAGGAGAAAPRRGGAWLLGGAAATLAGLMSPLGGYPVTMLGGSGSDARPAVHPPSLTLVALECAAIGLLWLLYAPLERRLSHPARRLRPGREATPPGSKARQATWPDRRHRRPGLRAWGAAGAAAASAMLRGQPVTVLCAHQAVAAVGLVVVAVLAPGAAVPGLTAAPDGLGWLAAHLVWMGLEGVGLVAVGRLSRRR